MSWLKVAEPIAALMPTVYASRRCDACGRTNGLTRIEPIAPTTVATRPRDVTAVEVCADWRECLGVCRKKGLL